MNGASLRSAVELAISRRECNEHVSFGNILDPGTLCAPPRSGENVGGKRPTASGSAHHAASTESASGGRHGLEVLASGTRVLRPEVCRY